MHSAQAWAINISSSACATRLRLLCGILLVIVSGYLTFTISPLSHSLRWWGDWLWPWPILLYASWLVAKVPAPLLPPQQVRLTEQGQLGHCRIELGLVTPWLVAMRCSTLPTSEQVFFVHASRSDILVKPGQQAWQWLCKDQLSRRDWRRLMRVCRHCRGPHLVHQGH